MTAWGLWGAPEWARPAMVLLAIGIAALLWGYWRASSSFGLRALAAMLKTVGLAALALCLVEPLMSGIKPRPGANLFAVAVDNSQSMQIRDARGGESRGEGLRDTLRAESSWQTRLEQDFDLRRFTFARKLHGVQDFTRLDFAGEGTALLTTLRDIEQRFCGLPLGGVLLMTDGNATDKASDLSDWSGFPPIYPVVVGADDVLPDIRIDRLSVQQTNFETAPISVHADIRSVGMGEQAVEVTLSDEESREIETQSIEMPADREFATVRFQIRLERPGIQVFRVTASAKDRDDRQGVVPDSDEATERNNTRSVIIDNGKGPYRVLYVSGRPNWDFKYLRRALADTDQLELVGLVRIAKREPKFTFRRRGERDGNRLFEGFNREDEETAERYDERVLMRLGTRDDQELRDGFPKAADELYQYDAIVLDDVEAKFFSPDQLAMIERFVSQRGGGLLMAGGVESFKEGGYRRTPIGDLLPVYVDPQSDHPLPPPESEFRLVLTREGWLQDWVRLRRTEGEEQERLATMPDFKTINSVGNLKPGAVELAQVADSTGTKHPAIVAQRFGRGRTAALLAADLWRWGLRRPDIGSSDLETSWRQMIRWLVADVPRRVEVEADAAGDPSSSGNSTSLKIRVHDAEYLPLENATVNVTLKTPDNRELQLSAEEDADEAGLYVAHHRSSVPGPHRVHVAVAAPDGSDVGECEAAWVAEPLADEFYRLQPDRELLGDIAAKTGGEVLELDDLDSFVASLGRRPLPVTETRIYPLWHHPAFFTFAIACLIGEWGLRRWKGLA